MALTSLFGTANSMYGNMLYGEWAASVLTPAPFPVDYFTSLIGSVRSRLGNMLIGQKYPDYYNGPLTSLYGYIGSWYGNETWGAPDSGAPIIKTVSVSSAFVIAESVIPGAILNRALTNFAVFTDLVVPSASVTSHLFFNQVVTVTGGVWNRSVSNSFVLAGTATRIATLNRLGSNTLTLAGVAAPGAILNRDTETDVVFTSEAGPGAILHQSISNTIVFSQVISRNILESVSSAFDMDMTATYVRVLHVLATNHCTFTQTAFCQSIFNLSVSNELLIAQSRNIPTGRGTYLTVPVVIVSVIPAFGAVAQMSCCSPTNLGNSLIIQSATSIITLPRPLLGDSEEQLGSVKINYSINGMSKITIKSSYLTKLSYTFELRRMKALELRQFLMNNDAVILTMTNWKGEIWYCNIVNAPISLIAKSRWAETNACGGNEAINVTLEFEGIKIGG